MEAIIAAIIGGVFLLGSKFLQDYLERNRQANSENPKPTSQNKNTKVIEKGEEENPEELGSSKRNNRTIKLFILIYVAPILITIVLGKFFIKAPVTDGIIYFPLYIIIVIIMIVSFSKDS